LCTQNTVSLKYAQNLSSRLCMKCCFLHPTLVLTEDSTGTCIWTAAAPCPCSSC
jgi:hypothetical protein